MEVFADHFEKVQWASITVPSGCQAKPIRDSLPVKNETISMDEVALAVRKLKNGRATVEVSAELLKAVMSASTSTGASWLLNRLQLCWDTKTTPSTWHVS